MKRGISGTIKIPTECNIDELDEGEFIFKAEEKEDADVLLKKMVDGASYNDGCFTIELTANETRYLPEGIVYIQGRLKTADGRDLATDIEKIRVEKTLFGIDD